jgi:hypothetical protein
MRNPAIISYGSLVVVESIWWFAALAAIGGSLGMGGSPIPWAALLALTSIGIISSWVMGGAKGDATTIALLQGAVALVVVYFTVAAATTGDSWSFKIGWPVDMFGGTYPAADVTDLVIALVAASALWYRSQGLIAGGGIAIRLSRAFKMGTAFIAIALLVQVVAIGSDIGVALLLVPFFGAALIGLAASRLPQAEETGQASWPVVIGISVASIIGVGIVGGLLTGRYGNNGVRGLINLWSAFVDALLWVLRYPIEWLMNAIFAILLWLKEKFNPEEPIEDTVEPGAPPEALLDETAEKVEKSAEYALDALRWPLSVLLVLVLFFVLVFAYKRFSARKNEDGDDNRESIRGDANAKADMLKLLGSLVPNWMKRNQRALWKWPEGDKGIADAFLLYFDTLTHAIKRGMIFDPNSTPNERIPALAVFLPGAPIDAVTTRFNAACYGAEPTASDEISRLRSEIETAAKRPMPSDDKN